MTRRRTLAGRIALLLTTIVVFASAVIPSHAQRVTLPGHVLDALANTELVKPVAKAADADDELLTLTLVLKRHDQDGFDRFLADVYNPGSPRYRRFATAIELADRFGPAPAAYAAVRDYLLAQGFKSAEESSNRMTLSVTGTRRLAERVLAVSIVDRKSAERTFRATVNDPSLPAEIAAHVEAIVGLSTLAKPRSFALISWFKKQPCKEAADNAGYSVHNFGKECTACTKAVDTCSTTQKLDAAEKADVLKVCDKFCKKPSSDALFTRVPAKDSPVPWKDVTGLGQKIALVGFDTYLPSDVKDFLDLFGTPDSVFANLSQVHVNGGAPLGPEQTEVLLDIQTVMINAPDAQVVVYDAPFTGGGSFQALFNRAISDGVTIISNSWTYCEAQTSAADVLSIDSILATAAAAGISVFNASGDTGSTCLGFAPNSIGVPAGSPNATAVGGTTMITGPDNVYVSETFWDGTAATPRTGQGGFGVSRFFARPAYQAGLNPSSLRSIPDVAFNSDPAQGTILCQASLGGCPAPVLIGGTSMAAPSWAAATALMNQAVGRNLGLLNPQIYPLAATDAFHSAASMGSDFAHVGLGSPNLNRMQLALRGAVAGPVSASQSKVVPSLDSVPADGTSSTFVVVRLQDADGNMISGKTVTLAAGPGSSAVITPASGVSSTSNGAVVFTVKNATVQNVTFTATDVTDGVVLASTPTVQFVVPPAAAGGINAFPTTVQNNGVATTTITITLQDAQGAPTPGKVVALSQGNGHSIITAPVPAVTNASGQIAFTATNRIAETVTYTAVVVTDGDVPVPGSAVVTFSGQASAQCAGAVTAAPGYAVTPFATGFLAEAFSFSNINFSCAGTSDPTFDPSGTFLTAQYRTGDLYRMPAEGGAVSTANRLSSPGMTMQKPVYGKDGKLYIARAATGAGFFSGQILEVDPQSGATIRTLASNLPCVTPLGVDPLSGDLFFAGTCFGAGSDDARLFRLANPGSASPTLSTYATLPGTPNGAVAIAPDGTIFVAIRYTAPAPQPEVVRVSGTNQPQPPTVTTVPGVNTVFWVNIGETLPNGAAKSLIVNTSDGKLKLADITTNPPTFTELLTTGASSGTIGPDRCLYISNGETIYKLTTAAGTCGFAPTSLLPSIQLTPGIAVPDPQQGTIMTLTAKLVGVANPSGTAVLFIVSGANPQFLLGRADSTGIAQVSYRGLVAGSDRVFASVPSADPVLRSNTARIRWTAGPHTTFVSLDASPTSAINGQPVTLTASIVDIATNPVIGVAGITLQFNVAGQSCNGVTNASGVASCQVTIPLVGNYTLSVTFPGNASFVAASETAAFTVLAAGPPPCQTFNDVDSTSIFCANVLWIRNRSVTFGCLASFYCPNDAVTRLQMAAFMNRLGTALTAVLRSNAAQPGPLDLDAQPVVCQTTDFATDTFTRRAYVDASFSGFSAAGTGFAADVVATFDNGATWVPLAAVGNRAFAGAGQWAHVRASGIAELTEGQTVRFGVWVSRGGLAGGADLTDSRCKLRAAIGNR